MARAKERSEVEYLRGLVRELKSEIRHLKKRMGKTEKENRRYEQSVEDSKNEETEVAFISVDNTKCPLCSDKLIMIDKGLAKEILHRCRCGYKKTVKK